MFPNDENKCCHLLKKKTNKCKRIKQNLLYEKCITSLYHTENRPETLPSSLLLLFRVPGIVFRNIKYD